jgi:hypothetical protein
MSNLSDKEIDRLSREAADSFEPNDSSLSWSRLEQKLAQQMPERPPDGFRFGRINPYVWGSAIILLTGASFFFIKNSFYSQHSTLNKQSTTQSVSLPGADNKNASGKALPSAGTTVIHPGSDGENKMARESDRKSALSSEPGPVADAGTASRAAVKNSYALQNAAMADERTSRNNAASNAIKSGSAFALGATATSHSAGVEEKNETDINGTLAANESAQNAGYSQNKNQIRLPFVIIRGAGLGKVSGNDSLMNQLAKSKTPIHQKSLHLNRSLNIGFTFGPDYTNAGGIANNQIGNNIGLTFGYYLTDKLSINTGIIYSNKFYWSDAHNYFFAQPANITPFAYASSFAAPPPIDYINGSSNIWELPLTLRYDFAHHNKTKFFANAGLSSYFMMKQTYIYFLHSGQRQLAYKIADNQQVNYWFGAADISAGFEAEIGKGFSFQAEPFLKLPLRDMGTENLKLTSYGFLMTFKYAPVLSRTKR